MAELGKRYKCEQCGSEVLCTKKGDGEFICHNNPMIMLEPKPIGGAD